MITHIRGILKVVAEETLTLAVEPFEVEVLIPEHTRRQVQAKLGEPIALHTIFYIDGNAMTGQNGSPAGRLPVADRPRVLRHILLGGRRGRSQGTPGDGAAGPRTGPHDRGPGREDAGDLSWHWRGHGRTHRGQAPPQGGQVCLDHRLEQAAETGGNGETEYAGPDIIRDTYAALLSVGHTESQARQAIDLVMSGKKKFKSVADMIEAIYHLSKE